MSEVTLKWQRVFPNKSLLKDEKIKGLVENEVCDKIINDRDEARSVKDEE